jgi:hypothetical protein
MLGSKESRSLLSLTVVNEYNSNTIKDARTYLFIRIESGICEWKFCTKHVVCILLSAFCGFDTFCDPDVFEGGNRT